MSDLVFGLDFGTTNSLAALVVRNQVQALTNEADGKPHPSVVWYRGSDIVVGRDARGTSSPEGGVAQLLSGRPRWLSGAKDRFTLRGGPSNRLISSRRSSVTSGRGQLLVHVGAMRSRERR